MTRDEAINRLQFRKDFLQSQCQDCWTEEMEMALEALMILNVMTKYADGLERESEDNGEL